jgi:uncharacterized membrane protein (GlpM family)
MGQLLVRFILGGLVVAAFAVVGDVLRPKRFAGIFGAAPAVALSTLVLVFMDQGAQDAAVMGRSMMAGAAGFLVYSVVVALAVDHLDLPGWLLAGGAWLVWLAVSFAVWELVLP